MVKNLVSSVGPFKHYLLPPEKPPGPIMDKESLNPYTREIPQTQKIVSVSFLHTWVSLVDLETSWCLDIRLSRSWIHLLKSAILPLGFQTSKGQLTLPTPSLECGFICVYAYGYVCLSKESFCLQLCEYFTQSHVGFKGLSFSSSDIRYASTISYFLLKCFINSRQIYGLFWVVNS